MVVKGSQRVGVAPRLPTPTPFTVTIMLPGSQGDIPQALSTPGLATCAKKENGFSLFLTGSHWLPGG